MGFGSYCLLLGGLILFTVLFLQRITYKTAKSCGIVKLCFSHSLLKIAILLLISVAIGAGCCYLTVCEIQEGTHPVNFGASMTAILVGILLCFGAAMLAGIGYLTKAGWLGFGMGRPQYIWAEETNGEIVFYRMEMLANGEGKPRKHLTFERSRENRERFAMYLQNENE